MPFLLPSAVNRLSPAPASSDDAVMATIRRADMFTADGKPSDDDPREHGPRLGDERATLVEALRCQRGMPVGLVEEYARHMGHVDLLRERIDGRVGQ